MTNEYILRIAMIQSALDASCEVGDFCNKNNVVGISRASEGARKYLNLPFYCNLITYGNNYACTER